MKWQNVPDSKTEHLNAMYSLQKINTAANILIETALSHWSMKYK